MHQNKCSHNCRDIPYIQCKPKPCVPKQCEPKPCEPKPCKSTSCKPTSCKPTPCKPTETVTHDFKVVLGECKVKRNVTYTHCIVANVEHTINENIVCNHKPITQHKITNKKIYANGNKCTAKPTKPKQACKPNTHDDDMSSLYSCTKSLNQKSKCKKYPISQISSDTCSQSN